MAVPLLHFRVISFVSPALLSAGENVSQNEPMRIETCPLCSPTTEKREKKMKQSKGSSTKKNSNGTHAGGQWEWRTSSCNGQSSVFICFWLSFIFWLQLLFRRCRDIWSYFVLVADWFFGRQSIDFTWTFHSSPSTFQFLRARRSLFSFSPWLIVLNGNDLFSSARRALLPLFRPIGFRRSSFHDTTCWLVSWQTICQQFPQCCYPCRKAGGQTMCCR